MIEAAFAGFRMSLALILAIGAQNAFVLRQGLRREHVFAVCAFCAISDAVLISVGVAGFGALAQAAPWFGEAMRWGGAAFLLAYGARAGLSAWRGTGALALGQGGGAALLPTLAAAAAITWLNPHVYLDTVVLLGAVSAQYPGQGAAFALGGMTASLLFFLTLGYGARLVAPLFARPVAWRVLDGVVAVVMWSLAVGLIW
jgi:L-lysine exporter family protein LysE/ArgO